MKEVPLHEIFCNNAEAFQANTKSNVKLLCTDSDACEGASGLFNAEEEICEGINSLGPNDCEAIPGFTPKNPIPILLTGIHALKGICHIRKSV